MTDLESDILELGLASRVAALAKADAGRLIEARRALRQRLDTLGIANLVENFDASRYNEQANVGENLLFAAVGGSAQSMQDLAHDPQVSRLLAANELHGVLCDIGARIVRVLGELLSQVEPGQPFYEQAAFQRLAKLPIADIVSTGTSGEGQAKQEPTESQLIALALCYAESEHRLGVLDGAARDRIVSARGAIRRAIPAHVADRIAFYESDGLIAGANIEDNVLFGRVVRGIADGQRRVRIEIRAALDRLGLLSAVLSAGLCAPVGPGGKMLAIAQRQKVALVRAVIKGSDVIVVNRGLSALGLRSQRAIIERILEYNRSKASPQRSSIIWALQDPRLTELFDRVLVFDDGRIVEDGEPGHLLASKGRLHSLLS